MDHVDVNVHDSRSIDEILASIAGDRESHPEIFEALKSVAQARPTADDILPADEAQEAAPPRPAAGTTTEQFICPVCESSVNADATVCPSCGARFAEGESSEFECPVCRSSVGADEDRCPTCGVHFEAETEPKELRAEPPPPKPAVSVAPPSRPSATPAPATPATPAPPPRAPAPSGVKLKERIAAVRQAKRQARTTVPSGDRKLLYRELPKLVNDVKALLVSARKFGLDLEQEKRLINEAIAAGKQRDIERAVRVIGEARHSLDIRFTEFLAGKIENFMVELSRAGIGGDAASVERELQEAVNRLEAGNYETAFDQLQTATTGFQAQAKDYLQAKEALDENARLLRELNALGIDAREIEKLIQLGRDAMGRRDQGAALRAARQAKDRLTQELPRWIQEEMRRARETLLDMKVRGADLSKPIGILKAASVQVKKEEWGEAIRYLKEFRKGMNAF